MDAFEKKTLKVSRGYTYTYYVVDGDKSLPTLVFHHGWPDHAAMWKKVATGLLPTNHPMIIPDNLGYDGTDKPVDPVEYRFDRITKDINEIIEAEGPAKVVSIGHDWGSYLASRLYNHYPERIVGLININQRYTPPTGDHFDLDQANASMEQHFGTPLFSYWEVFAAKDAPELLHDNLDRLYSVQHGEGSTLRDLFTVKGALKRYLIEGGKKYGVRPYAQDPTFKQEFFDRMERDGFAAPQCWYYAMAQNHQSASDRQLLVRSPQSMIVNVPALFIPSTDDPWCFERKSDLWRSERTQGPKVDELMPKLEDAEPIDAGHWVAYEAPKEIVERISPWLKKICSK